MFVQRYWAFLSYSHQDSASADWLHNALECFRVPKRMVGKGTPYGLVPARLAPVFRDQHDLAAGEDLSDVIQEALASSRFLVVLCSPAAVASRWVNEEIRLYKRLRPDGEIFAVIVEGEPWASDMLGREAEECFPPALRIAYDDQGLATEERAEPIAADLRPRRDGPQVALHKLVAGMLDVGLDDLVQRETQRRHRHMMGVAAGSFIGMLGAGALAFAALEARDEARDQRREAEGLVGFMLGDLKDKLEPVGRLDVLDAVGARALAYYEAQDKGALSDESLAQRSRALTLMGDLAQRRGDLDGALRRYREAAASTSELLRRYPNDPQRMFDHAQNVFYIGYVAWDRGQTAEALASFRDYQRLANAMIAREPTNEKWRLEKIYADTQTGIVLNAQQQFGQAERVFTDALLAADKLVAAHPADTDLQDQQTEGLAYLADAKRGGGKLDEALALRQRQLSLLERYQASRPKDLVLTRRRMGALDALAGLQLMQGNVAEARIRSDVAISLAQQLLASEPNNTEWASRAATIYFTASRVRLGSGEAELADSLARSGCDLVNRLMVKDQTVVSWSERLKRECLLRRAAAELARGRPAEAQQLADDAGFNALAAQLDLPDRRSDFAEAHLLAGAALARLNKPSEALRKWQAGLRQWPGSPVEAPDDLAVQARLLRFAGDFARSGTIARRLNSMGYRDPSYLQMMSTAR